MSKSARAKHGINLVELRSRREAAIALGRPWQDAEQVHAEYIERIKHALGNPFRRVLNYESLARAMFKIEPLPISAILIKEED